MIKQYRVYRNQQVVGAALVNWLFNAALAWLAFRQLPQVPLFGASSIVGDTLGTAVLLPLFVTLAATPTFRSLLARRVVLLPQPGVRRLPLPQQPLLLGLALGLLAALTLAPLALGLLAWLEVRSMAFSSFLLFKVGFAALLAALITPLVLQRAAAWHLVNRRF